MKLNEYLKSKKTKEEWDWREKYGEINDVIINDFDKTFPHIVKFEQLCALECMWVHMTDEERLQLRNIPDVILKGLYSLFCTNGQIIIPFEENNNARNPHTGIEDIAIPIGDSWTLMLRVHTDIQEGGDGTLVKKVSLADSSREATLFAKLYKNYTDGMHDDFNALIVDMIAFV